MISSTQTATTCSKTSCTSVITETDANNMESVNCNSRLPRRRPLCDAIVAGFESLGQNNTYPNYDAAVRSGRKGNNGGRGGEVLALGRNSGAAGDGDGDGVGGVCRGIGFVVWIPRSNVEQADSRHVVLYGGGHDGLVTVREHTIHTELA